MAFGGGSGFSFGSNNNSTSTFGGFGSNNNNNNNNPSTGAFGSTSNSGGFGTTSTTTNPFGGGAAGGGAGGFGSNSGGFGNSSNTSSGLFGNKTPSTGLFGSNNNPSSSAGGLFGSTNNNTSTGFGSSTTAGFGSSTNNNAFGSNSNTGFGSSGFGNTANKPSFGANNSTASTLFGQGGAGTTGGFGSSGNTFGGSGTALGQNVPPSQGTAVVPFAPTSEKDQNGTMQNFQSINFMEPYQKYCFEELRLADYNAGRRFGNGTGQPAGGFGSSSTFGGFGSNNTTTGFGSNNQANQTNQTNNPFGSNASTSGTFGANASSTFGGGGSGGLFGQNKPATGGLFGQPQSSSTTGGGLFGTSNNNTSSNPFSANNTSSGFGSNNPAGGGLFGNNNSTQQNKPGGLFGNTGTTSGTAGFSFGANNQQQQSGTIGGGLFGNNSQQSSGTGLFGNNNNQQQQQQQQQNKPGGLFGNSTGGSFGSNATGQTSGGLFGTSTNTNTTGGGLFGNNNASNTGTAGGLFGNNSTTNTGGGLFGNNAANNQNKSGGLFGNNAFGNNQQQQSTGTGPFGNNQQQANTGGGLFGNNTNNNTSSGGFSFGNTQNKPAGGLFTSSTNNQSGGLFGGGNSTGGNSLFGNSMNQSQQAQQQQPDIKHASLLDSNPYGQSSIWTGLPAATEQNSQPLVTALTATQKLKESQAKPPPNLRLNQSRYMTPPRRPGGYGFTYSTYGTPNSAASTPGGNSLSTSMYGSRFTGGSFGRSMGKAASISNMRSYYSEGESVLAPGAFTTSSSRYSSGSIRRLTIDRSIRDDLFSPRPALPAPAANNTLPTTATKTTNGVTSPQVNDAAPENFGSKLKKRVSFDKDTTGGENGTLNGETGAVVPVEDDDATTSPSGTVSPSEPATNGLTTVPEDRESENAPAPRPVKDKNDPRPGEFWIRPSYEEITRMSREQASQYRGLQVGRHGCGFVTFDGAVDLKSLAPPDVLFGTIINIGVRSITVYPESGAKPPRGKGLNVPSTLTIENSWPRARGKPEALSSGPLFEKHVKRLKSIGNTKFVSYDVNTGVWVFKVDHYTTYGLDYDDEEDDFGTSQLSAPPDSIKAPDSSVMEVDSDHTSDFGEDDTFHGRQLLTVPGGFGKRSAIDSADDSIVKSIEYDSPRSEQSDLSEDEASDNEGPDMAGSYPDLPVTETTPQKPHLQPGTPGRLLLDIDLDGDWAEQLQRTISPRKQNRDALREAQNKVLLDREFSPIKPGTLGKKNFRTSIDVMNSIFDKRGGETDSAGFEFPYAKRPKTFGQNENDMSDADKAWHASFKPHFTPEGKLIVKPNTAAANDKIWKRNTIARSHNRTIVLNELTSREPLSITDLTKHAAIELTESGIPEVDYKPLPFSAHAASLPSTAPSAEAQLYELLHILFDTYEDSYTTGLSEAQREDFADRIRKDRLSAFLSGLITRRDKTSLAALEQRNPLEAALRYFVRGDAIKSSDLLYKTRNPTLALLVAQAPNAGEEFQSAIAEQIDDWREQSALSEIDLHIRALYELLAGNTSVSQGLEGTTLEHKASTFSISDLLGLDWLTMFALNLWYGTHKTSSIEDIIGTFAVQLASGEETATPVLAGTEAHEDVLWVALKIYASIAVTTATQLKSPTLPQALSALAVPYSGFSSLSLFRTYHSLSTSLPAMDVQVDIDENAADQLAADLAAECEMRGDVPGAVWAMLHISEEQARGRGVVELLLRHAARLPLPPSSMATATATGVDADSEGQWKVLTEDLAVPQEWLYQALALLKRSEGGDASEEELKYLVLADEVEMAHECLVERVAPAMVVDADWEGLGEVLSLFGTEGEGNPEGWRGGGGVFEDFLRLVVATGGASGGGGQGGAVAAGEEREVLVTRLARSLAGMARDVEGQGKGQGGAAAAGEEGIVQVRRRVAVREMARSVVELVSSASAGGGDAVVVRDVLMELPLTGEIRARLGREMAREYYGKVMAGRA